ncbi:MAG: hypothetical protein GWP91_12745, partial [Rhodobacterales bacterium]|nr:hypothetical protein [Rhodobacterales bacterium]
MKRALVAYVDRVGKGGDHLQGVIAASEAVAERPWDVVHLAGRLGRGRLAIAAEDFGITAALKKVKVDNVRAVVRIAKGQPHPTSDHKGRRSRGAFDTPVDMARRVVSATIRAGKTPPRIGLDPACGTGAFLVAMLEAGVPEVYGTDLDPVALAVAQVAAPKARLLIDDGLKHGPEVDMHCGNPPFVPPERQSKELRTELRRRFPWLRGRFDLVIPFAAAAAARVKSGGSIGLVLPAPALVQPYGAVLRRRWIQRHRLVDLSGPHPFPGASVKVMLVVMQIDGGPSPLPAFGISPEELLRLENVPLNADLRPGDVDLVERIRRDSVPLSSLCLVDTGLVAHGPDGGKARLLYDEPGERRVPYADARGF